MPPSRQYRAIVVRMRKANEGRGSGRVDLEAGTGWRSRILIWYCCLISSGDKQRGRLRYTWQRFRSVSRSLLKALEGRRFLTSTAR